MANFHLPLPDPMHDELREASSRLGRPATELVREALHAWLAAYRRRLRQERVREWAEAHAGTAHDLDPDLEDQTIGHLLAAESEE